ncbi:hypothetical protein ACTLLP_08670 [Desulfothermobacter acidiphilus]
MMVGNKRRLLFWALAGGAGVLVLVFLFFLPQWRAYVQARENLDQVQKELNRYRQLQVMRPMDEKRLEELKRDPLMGYLTLDARQGADVILLGLQAAAKKVKVVNFEPGQVLEGEYLQALPLQIGVEGSYPDVLGFIEGLETGAVRNLVEIRSFKLMQGQVPGTVRGEFAAVLYMDKTPKSRLILEEVGKWSLGRVNVFQP